MPVSADLTKILDREYEDLPLADVLNAPVEALAGVSKADADLLKSAFQVKTVRDLGRNKYFRAATALVDLEASTK
jgi:hypothetical protein